MSDALRKRHSKAVRWGHLKEIDYRTNVDTPAWHSRHPLRIKHLSSWRRLHMLAPHETISDLASRSPSSDMPLAHKIELGKMLEEAAALEQAEKDLSQIADMTGVRFTPPPNLF